MFLRKPIAIIVVLLLAGAVRAQTEVPHEFQAGQPALASEVNENFDALESVIDTNSSAKEARLDGLLFQLANIEKALEDLGAEYAVCSARNISACNGFLGVKNIALLAYVARFRGYIVTDPETFNYVFAIAWEKNLGSPTDPTDDSLKLIFGEGANFGRGTTVPDAEVLVDSCEDPTVYLVPTGAPPTGGLGVDNGKVYITDADDSPVTVDVTGGSFGLIHDFTKGFPADWNRLEGPPPMCFPVDDRVGLYDSYPLILREDTSSWGEEWSPTADDVLNQ